MQKASVAMVLGILALVFFQPPVASGSATAGGTCAFSMCGNYNDGEHDIDFACDIHTRNVAGGVEYTVYAITQVKGHVGASRTIASCEVDHWDNYFVHAHSDMPGPVAVGADSRTLPDFGPVVICWGISVWFLDGHHAYFFIGAGGVC